MRRPSRTIARCAAVALAIGSVAACRMADAGPTTSSPATWASSPTSDSTAPARGSSLAPEPVMDSSMLSERALRRFDRAVLWKPTETNAMLDPYLAPLVVFEASTSGSAYVSIGEPTPPANDRATHADPARPTIYWISEPIPDWPPRDHQVDADQTSGARQATSTIPANGAKPRADSNEADGARASGTRTTFLTFLSGPADPPAADRPASWIALVVWSDESKLPRAWEVVSSANGGGLLFASRALEDAAKREFGAPLPGRTYSLERGLDETPNAVVVRLLEDSPVPMGPYLYVDANRRVSTVACRCMASQVGEFIDTRQYLIAAFDPLRAPFAASGASRSSGSTTEAPPFVTRDLPTGADPRPPCASRSEPLHPPAAGDTNRREPRSTDAAAPTGDGTEANKPGIEPVAAARDAASFPGQLWREIQRRSTLPNALRWPERIQGDGGQAPLSDGP